METDEDTPIQGSSDVAAPLQLTTPQSDEDGGRRRRDVILLSCDPLTLEPMKQPQVQSWERRQSPQLVPTGLTED